MVKKGNKNSDVQFTIRVVWGKNNGLTAQLRVKSEADDTRMCFNEATVAADLSFKSPM